MPHVTTTTEDASVDSGSKAREYGLVRWLYLRFLGIIYLIAFSSTAVQIKGLVGEQGIIPAHVFLDKVAQQVGPTHLWSFPTIFWLGCTDFDLTLVCWSGVALAVLVVLGIATQPALAILWFLYLSVLAVGGDFLSYQWDVLLLEAGFLSIFFADSSLFDAPWRVSRFCRPQTKPSRLILWLLRLLLFKLMFLSGVVKISSGDPTWHDLTALTYHYWTQPLPTPLAWFADKLPEWIQKCSVAVMFAIELGSPFLIFGPGKSRYLAAFCITFLQVLIALTGNYTFFNFLTICLCLTLLDDSLLKRILPARLVSAVAERVSNAPSEFKKWIECFIAALIGFLTAVRFIPGLLLLPATGMIIELTASLNLVNNYGLFAVMTTERKEIVMEGSDDGVDWKAYEFPYKPGELKRAPPVVAPFQPRLDWQMWFAALGSFRDSPWMKMFILRLLEGAPDVLALLEHNPFPDHPPKYIRSVLYEYHFSTFSQLKATGQWWTRKYLGLFTPAVCLPIRSAPPAGAIFKQPLMPDAEHLLKH